MTAEMDLHDVDALATLHEQCRFELVSTVGQDRRLHLNGDTRLPVSVLIAMARFAAVVRILAEERPNARASTVVLEAQRLYGRQGRVRPQTLQALSQKGPS